MSRYESCWHGKASLETPSKSVHLSQSLTHLQIDWLLTCPESELSPNANRVFSLNSSGGIPLCIFNGFGKKFCIPVSSCRSEFKQISPSRESKIQNQEGFFRFDMFTVFTLRIGMHPRTTRYPPGHLSQPAHYQ